MITPPSWIQQQHLMETGRPRPVNWTGETPVSPLQLFYFDRSSSFRELLLNVLGFLLRYALFHGLGSAIHQILGIFQAQARSFAYTRNHVTLPPPTLLYDNCDSSLLLGLTLTRHRNPATP